MDAQVAQRVRDPGAVAPEHQVLTEQPHPQRRIAQRVGVGDGLPAAAQGRMAISGGTMEEPFVDRAGIR